MVQASDGLKFRPTTQPDAETKPVFGMGEAGGALAAPNLPSYEEWLAGAKKVFYPVQWALDQLSRTGHGVSNLTLSRLEGEDWPHAVQAMKRGLALEERPTGVDIYDKMSQMAANLPPETAKAYEQAQRFFPVLPTPEERHTRPRSFAEEVLTNPQSSMEARLAATQMARPVEGLEATIKGGTEGLKRAMWGLGWDVGTDPITYATLGAGASGKATAEALAQTGKGMGTLERAGRAAKVGARFFGRRGMGGLSVAGRSVINYPALSEIAHIAKLPELSNAIRGLPAAKELGTAFNVFFRYAEQDPKQWEQFVKTAREYPNKRDAEIVTFMDEVLQEMKRLGITREEAQLASHAIQYDELLKGSASVEDAIAKAKAQLPLLKQERLGVEAKLGVKTDLAVAAKKRVEKQIAALEQQQAKSGKLSERAKAIQAEIDRLKLVGEARPSSQVPPELLKAERKQAVAEALAKREALKAKDIDRLTALQEQRTQIEQLLEYAGPKTDKPKLEQRLLDLDSEISKLTDKYVVPETLLRMTAEQAEKLSPESLQRIQAFAGYGKGKFKELLERGRAAGIPIEKRADYVPGMYPERLFYRGGKYTSSKQFPYLMTAKAAAKSPAEMPVEHLGELIVKRGAKGIADAHTSEFIRGVVDEFGEIPQIVDDRLMLAPGKKLFAWKDTLDNPQSWVNSRIPEWVNKRITKMRESAGTGLVALDEGELREAARLGKGVKIVALPEGMVDWINNYASKSRQAVSGVGARAWDGFTGYWKSWSTVMRLPFHARNIMDNYWRLFLDIGPDAFNPKWNTMALKLATGAKGSTVLHGRRYSFDELRRIILDQGGARHGWVGGDMGFPAVDAMNRLSQSWMRRAASTINPLSTRDFAGMRLGRWLGEHAEDHAYAVSFLKNLDGGGDAYKAMQRTKQFLIDYRELTNFEKSIRRWAMPFYGFFRKNVPLQLTQMVQQPGKYAAIPKVKRAIESLSDEPQESGKPQYFEKAYAVRLPVVRKEIDPTTGKVKEYQQYANTMLSFQELNQLTTLSDLIARLHPIVKSPIELFAEKEAFMDVDDALATDKLVEVPALWQKLPDQMRELMQIHKYQVRPGEYKWQMPARVKYAIKVMSPYSVEFGRIALPPELEKEGWKFDAKRYLLGGMVQEVDPEKQRLADYYDERKYRGMFRKKIKNDVMRVE